MKRGGWVPGLAAALCWALTGCSNPPDDDSQPHDTTPRDDGGGGGDADADADADVAPDVVCLDDVDVVFVLDVSTSMRPVLDSLLDGIADVCPYCQCRSC